MRLSLANAPTWTTYPEARCDSASWLVDALGNAGLETPHWVTPHYAQAQPLLSRASGPPRWPRIVPVGACPGPPCAAPGVDYFGIRS
jgi:hypothetical protein